MNARPSTAEKTARFYRLMFNFARVTVVLSLFAGICLLLGACLPVSTDTLQLLSRFPYAMLMLGTILGYPLAGVNAILAPLPEGPRADGWHWLFALVFGTVGIGYLLFAVLYLRAG